MAFSFYNNGYITDDNNPIEYDNMNKNLKNAFINSYISKYNNPNTDPFGLFDIPPGGGLIKDGVYSNKEPSGCSMEQYKAGIPESGECMKSQIGKSWLQYSVPNHEPIIYNPQPVQIGAGSVHDETKTIIDNKNTNVFTDGIQYYTMNQGVNPKTWINPVIYPQAYRKEVWVNSSTADFAAINQDRMQDITEEKMDYYCGECDIPSYSLGTPPYFISREKNAPLAVQLPGQYPVIGHYTGETMGSDVRDKRIMNPIIQQSIIDNSVVTDMGSAGGNIPNWSYTI